MYIINFLKKWFMIVKKPEYQYLKTMVAIIINVWLLIIFWKIFTLEDSTIVNNSVLLSQIESVLHSFLSYLNLDLNVLDPNTLKMLILTFIILTANLIVLQFNHIIILGILIWLVRYVYKIYINHINAIKVVESADEIIAKIEDISKTTTTIITKPEYVTAAVDTNWWFFTIIAISVIIISILAIAIMTNQIDVSNIKFNIFKKDIDTKLTKFNKNNVTNQHIIYDIKKDIIQLKYSITEQNINLKNEALEFKTAAIEAQNSVLEVKTTILENKLKIQECQQSLLILNQKQTALSNFSQKQSFEVNNLKLKSEQNANLFNQQLESKLSLDHFDNYKKVIFSFLEDYTTVLEAGVEKLIASNSSTNIDVNNDMNILKNDTTRLRASFKASLESDFVDYDSTTALSSINSSVVNTPKESIEINITENYIKK